MSTSQSSTFARFWADNARESLESALTCMEAETLLPIDEAVEQATSALNDACRGFGVALVDHLVASLERAGREIACDGSLFARPSQVVRLAVERIAQHAHQEPH